MRLLFSSLLLLGCAGPAFAQNSLPPGTASPDQPAAPAANVADPLGHAEELLGDQKYAAARALLEPYVSAHPTDARALFDLGYVAQAGGDTTTAAAMYRKAIAANALQFEAHSALGLLLAQQGNNAEAIAQLRIASGLTPNPANPEAQAQADRTLARLLLPTDAVGAGNALIAALKLSPETPADTLMAAEVAEHQGNVDAAADAYGKVVGESPAGSAERAQAVAGLAHLLIGAKRYPEAESVLRKALIDTPEDVALGTELADVLVHEDKKPDAISILQTLSAANPNDANIAEMLAQLQTETGAPDKAVVALKPLVAAHPQDAALQAELGDAMVRAGQFPEALPVLESATKLDPKNGNAWSSLAFAASQQHEPQLVLDSLAMRARVMSDTPATYFLTATAYDSLKQKKQAIAAYKQFLAVAGTQFPDEIWQAQHRLIALEH